MPDDDEIFRALQRHLNRGPVGYPATRSGSDVALLKQLFSPQDAQIATCLSTFKLEPAKTIHRRVKKAGIKMTPDELKQDLDGMVRKGIILVYSQGFTEKRYKNAGVTAGGIMDFQVNRLNPQLVEIFDRYHAEAFSRAEMTGLRSIPQLRTVPVEESIPTPEKHNVATYDDVRRLLDDSPGPFAVANCVCRQTRDMQGRSCAYSDIRETCLQIGTDHARQYVDMGIARYVSKNEAFEILEKAQRAGFILQPENSLRPEAICCCCGDCCILLSSIAKSPRPAAMYASNYFVEVDPALCKGCGVCVKRCQLHARTLVEGISTVNLDRCIGCGNCVITCESHATALVKKGKVLIPPKDKDAIFMKIMEGKVGRWNVVKLRLKMMLGMRV